MLADLSIPAMLRDVVLHYLAGLGERWQRGTASVAMEHFASNVIRGRLAGLARGWGSGHGPQALLACPPGEQHDLALMMFGIVLHHNGWRIGYLGANTPVGELASAAGVSHPDLIVVAAAHRDAGRYRGGAHRTRPPFPARPGRGWRHGAVRGRGWRPADGGRPGD